jgi:hypothetical protein
MVYLKGNNSDYPYSWLVACLFLSPRIIFLKEKVSEKPPDDEKGDNTIVPREKYTVKLPSFYVLSSRSP